MRNRTTETILEDYLVRQRWQSENYPNLEIEENEKNAKTLTQKS